MCNPDEARLENSGIVIKSPAHTTVECFWPGDPGAPGGRPNRVGFRYRAHVPGPIAVWSPAFPSALAADLARAEEAVRRLDRHGPLLATLAWPLLRAEAIASSRIEGLSASHRRLALAERGALDDPIASAVVRNLAALRRAVAAARDRLSAGVLDEVHRSLLADGPDGRIAGHVRDVQNWIGGRHPNPRGAAFVPPPPEELGRLITDLVAFCCRDDLPTVAQAAIAHVQFESLHPYVDGNGRVGRVLIHILLRRRGLSRAVLPPVSLVLAGDVDGYVAGLTAFRRGDAESWLRFFGEALFTAARIGEDLADGVRALQQEWITQAGSPRAGSAAAILVERLPEEPILDLVTARRLTGASAPATLGGIERLAASGVLREISGRRRGRLWASNGLFELLDRLDRLGALGRRARLRSVAGSAAEG